MFKQLNPLQKEFYPNRGRIVCLLGLPGIGKSTLAMCMVQELKEKGVEAKYFPENVNKKFLIAYLKEPSVLAASFQYTTAANRLCSYKEALMYIQGGGIAIMDGMLYSDPPFEILNYRKGNITEDLHNIYDDILSEAKKLPPPDYVCFLKGNVDTQMRRLGVRGNSLEIANYKDSFYPMLYSLNAEVLSDVDLTLIDYNTDYTSEELKNASIDILRTIFSNKELRKGLPPY